MINSLGIDVDTTGKGLLISKLKKLKSTVDCYDGGMYWMDKSYSQVLIQTTLTEDQLDDLLYNMSFPRCFDIVGCFETDRMN